MTGQSEMMAFIGSLVNKHNLRTIRGKRDFLAEAGERLKTLTTPGDIEYLETFMVQAFAVFLREMSRNEIEILFWAHIETGLPETKVRKLLGVPEQEQVAGTQARWIYPRGGSVCFVDGKVVTWKQPKKDWWVAFKEFVEPLLTMLYASW